MRVMVMVIALLAIGCDGEGPSDVDGGLVEADAGDPGDVVPICMDAAELGLCEDATQREECLAGGPSWRVRVCAEHETTVDGAPAIWFPVCGSNPDAILRCDDAATYVRGTDGAGGWVPCPGGELACASGATPRCVAVPCDGLEHRVGDL